MSNLNELEYEARLYGFTRHSIVTFMKEVIADFMEQGLESLSRKLIPLYGEGPMAQFVPIFGLAYQAAILRRSEELHKIVNDFFTISPNIVLPDDQICDELPEDEEARLDRQIETERRKYMALSLMERNLRNVLADAMKHDKDIAMVMQMSKFAGALVQNSQVLVSSANNLDLDSIFSNLSLNGS